MDKKRGATPVWGTGSTESMLSLSFYIVFFFKDACLFLFFWVDRMLGFSL